MFHLNETLANGTKPGDKNSEERVPIEHKFMMNNPGNQALYILKQADDASKGIEIFFFLNNTIKTQVKRIYIKRRTIDYW